MALGTWITNGTASPFYVRKVFTLDRPAAKAEAKVCGLGQFVFWLNGHQVGDHELDPGWTDYNKLVQYVPFEVTDLLRPGENALGVEVGNGWYIKTDEHYTFAFPPFMPPNPYRPFGDALVLAAELTKWSSWLARFFRVCYTISRKEGVRRDGSDLFCR